MFQRGMFCKTNSQRFMRRELSEDSPHAARKSCRQDLNLERGAGG